VVLCASGILVVAQLERVVPLGNQDRQIRSAWLNGRRVEFQLAPVPAGQRTLEIGPWYFGERVLYPTPRDRRLNLYLVSPGVQHRASGHEAYDHNDVINDLPVQGKPMEWDVYWAVVLDPGLDQDFRSESQLLLATQREFHPHTPFEFDAIPGVGFLRNVLNLRSLQDLDKYRRPSGNLPQVLIVPAGFAVRASVREFSGEKDQLSSDPGPPEETSPRLP
jgi:hypothetical protein